MKEADLILVIGTRLNYVIAHAKPPALFPRPRPSSASTSIRERSTAVSMPVVGIVGDAKKNGLDSALCCSSRQDCSRSVRLLARTPWQVGSGSACHRPRRRSARIKCRSTRCASAKRSRDFIDRGCDSCRRWPRDTNVCASECAEFPPRASIEFRALGHDGRRHALRSGREGSQTRQAGDRACTAMVRSG